MALKKKQQESTGSGIDFNFLHSQIEDDTHEARVSVIIDAGLQQPPTAVYGSKDNKDNVMYFDTRDEALDYMDEAIEIVGEWVADKEGYDEEPEEVEATKKLIKDYELESDEGDDVFRVDFKIVTPKEREEVIYAVDLVDTYVKYKEDDEDEKQFRVWLNKPDFKTKALNGFSTKFSPPAKQGAKWTFSPLSMHTKLAKATGKKGVINPDDDNFGDLSLFLDKPVGIQTTRKETTSGDKEYINLKTDAPVGLPKKIIDMGVSELDCTPEAVDWEEVTVEQLMNIMPNKLVMDKLKAASNYEGSQMQVALEEYEEIRQAEYKNNNSESDAEESADEPKENPKTKRASKKEKAKDNSKKKKKAKKKVEQEDDSNDDDIPF